MSVKIPKKLIAWLSNDYGSCSQRVIVAFHDITARGITPLISSFSREEQIWLKNLLDAHTAASREPSAIVEGLWADGYADYPSRVMLQYMIRAGVGNPDEWFKTLPVFERAYRFSLACHSGKGLRNVMC